jgi:transposase
MPRKVYSDEFKSGAVDQVIGQRHSISSVAKRLGLSYETLRKWVEDAKFKSPTSLIPTDLPAEQLIRELQKENARLRMERDILKKATAYFAKEQL